MAEEKKIPQTSCPDDTVYVLEGNPDEVYDADGNRIKLTKEQEKEVEDQI